MDEAPITQAGFRTDLAEDRTLLASERTFAGWMRTSLASVAIGIGSQALYAKIQPDWIPRLIATFFLVLAMVVVLLAERRARCVAQRLGAHVVVATLPVNLRLLSLAVAAGCVALILAIWLLPKP